MKYVLVCDDNPISLRIIQTLLKRLLSQDVWRIVCVSRAKEAMDMIEHIQFEYMFLDLRLPDGSGEAIARACKTTILNANSVLIAMTAYEHISNHHDLFSVSLEKPITFPQLRAIFEQ